MASDTEHPTEHLPATVTKPGEPERVNRGDHFWSKLDRTFGKAMMIGYALGLVVIFVFMVILLRWASDMDIWVAVAAAAAVAFWIGIMGGVIAVGMWSMRHEEEIFH